MTCPSSRGPASWRVPIALTLLGSALALPGLSQAACTIQPTSPAVAVGGSIQWSVTNVTGVTGNFSYSWTFSGGNPTDGDSSPTSSSLPNPTVTYRAAGSSTTRLTIRGNGRTSCSRSFNVSAAAGDTQAPTVPGNLKALPASETQVNLSWAASTDNQGVKEYRVERCTGKDCTGFSQVATTAATILSDTGLASGTLYSYRVRAADAAGNLSGYSPVATAKTFAPVPNASINSTSQDSVGQNTNVVLPDPLNPTDRLTSSYSVLAINDLGMHCGDLDTRVASILPPFQVLLAQVIRKGGEPELNPAGVELLYSAAQNPSDPILAQTAIDGRKADGSTYKTNFWDTVKQGAYDPFYPAYNPLDPNMKLTPLAGAPFNVGPDVGLPVPNVEEFYIGGDDLVDKCKVPDVPNAPQTDCDGTLTAVLHAMPGIDDPYVANSPQRVQEHYTNKPFFLNFPFGYVANDVNWYEGAGVPYAAFDDFGRENPYPVVRVQAKQGSSLLTTVDTVLPISGEASCTNCHSDPADVQDSRTSVPTDTLRAALGNAGVATRLDDPDSNMPEKVSVEYAADINILRLHDLKHGPKYVSPTGAADGCTINLGNPNGTASCLTNKALVQNKPVVCQVCHYTPALDLAQLGPLAGPPGTIANGRNQVAHKSNSNVMHSHHGTLKDANGDPLLDKNGIPLFPAIPAPIEDSNGVITNQGTPGNPAPGTRLHALENSCYQCHPGKDTKCLRGAMFNGGMLCSDCHGNMEQVGNDFSRDVSPSNPGAFILAKDFYTNPNTPRVPWANEPGCGSCHTGDARSNLSGTDVIKNVKDVYGNTDNIRLVQAWRTGDPKATPIVPTNKRFAEPVIPASFNGFPNPGAGNPKLYRVSSGHQGVMCEGCHGATHAEWPNANPNANDNLTAKQLQGHTGTVIECSTCHADGLSSYRGLEGPHGLHVVGSTSFARGGHKELAEQNPNACRACHGNNGEGTVLARIAADRVLQCKENGVFCGNSSTKLFPKGKMVRCDDCHRNEL
ncbi:MAG: fibronectin type III domain-containing protein [Bdellovibrio bacteriovorus]